MRVITWCWVSLEECQPFFEFPQHLMMLLEASMDDDDDDDEIDI